MSNFFNNLFKFFKGSATSDNMQANDSMLANLDAKNLDNEELIDVSWAGYATK